MNATLLAAIKLGDQIERFGSYAGYASVIGLGVLAMLYFSQAREVKRLREWAGRAPERDAELAQRVQSDAQRRVVAQPVPAPAAQPVAQPVQPAAPQTPAAQQAEAARKAAAAAVMQKFQQPAAGQTQPPTVGPPGQLARPGQPLVPGVPVSNAPAAGAPGGLGVPATTASPAPVPAVPPGAAAASAVAAARQEATPGRSPALTNGAGGQDTHESAAARPSPPLDMAPRTARAAGSSRPAAEDHGRSRARIGLIAGGAAAALTIAVVLVLALTGGSDTPPADNAIGGSPPPAASPPAAPSAPKVDRKATQVAVLNGTTQNGLAGSVADKIEDRGFTILSKGNNADQKVATTSVAFREGSEDAARIVAKVVDVPAGAVQPMDANTAAAVAAEANVVVIVGNNLGSTG